MYRYIRSNEEDIDEILTEEYLFFVVLEDEKAIESSKALNTLVGSEESTADDIIRDISNKAQFVDDIRNMLESEYGLKTGDTSWTRSETMRIGCMRLVSGKLLMVFADIVVISRTGEYPQRYPCSDEIDFSLVLEFFDTQEQEKNFGHDLGGLKEFVALKMNECMEKMIDRCKAESK